VPIFAMMAQRQVERWRAAQREVPTDAAAAMTRTTFEIIVESMLGGSARLDAERYSHALTDNFDTIPWHIIYVMFSIPKWMPYPHRWGVPTMPSVQRDECNRHDHRGAIGQH
jgi:hypothetical protein